MIEKHRDLEDLSRHAVREELRRIAEEYERCTNRRDIGSFERDSIGTERPVSADTAERLVYQDHTLIALREKLGGGR